MPDGRVAAAFLWHRDDLLGGAEAVPCDNVDPRRVGAGGAIDEPQLRRVKALIDDGRSPVGIALLDLHRREIKGRRRTRQVTGREEFGAGGGAGVAVVGQRRSKMAMDARPQRIVPGEIDIDCWYGGIERCIRDSRRRAKAWRRFCALIPNRNESYLSPVSAVALCNELG
jgi:hypothetical protein